MPEIMAIEAAALSVAEVREDAITIFEGRGRARCP
jgi:hypothetical protein